jgi:hypothetical protein
MKNSSLLSAAILTAAIILASPTARAQSSGVTGAGEGIFAPGAAFNGISLDGVELGTGMFINSDGSAAGDFHTVLLGTSLLGLPQEITVEGEVSSGVLGADGSATFSGSATVDLGDGSLPFLEVPFMVTATPQGLVLTLGTSTLPPATLTAGSITIE